MDAETLKTQMGTAMDHIQINSKTSTIKHLFKPKTRSFWVFYLQINCSRVFYLLYRKNTMRAANIFNGS